MRERERERECVKVVRAKFSTLSWAVLLIKEASVKHKSMPTSRSESLAQV
jgi:hypothetical protein